MRSISIFLVFLSFLVSATVSATTYKWTDENGNVVYSQHPPKSGSYERITGLKKSRSSAPEELSEAEKAQAKKMAETQENLEKAEKELVVRTKEVEQRLCEQAKNNHDAYTRNKRFMGEDGKIFRMDDNEREQKIKEAEEAIKEYCGE